MEPFNFPSFAGDWYWKLNCFCAAREIEKNVSYNTWVLEKHEIQPARRRLNHTRISYCFSHADMVNILQSISTEYPSHKINNELSLVNDKNEYFQYTWRWSMEVEKNKIKR